MDAQFVEDVAGFLLRWLHVVAGIAWIGASFYFVRLDLGLRPPRQPADAERGVAGEFWGVHGGGFYHSQKYRVAPPELPEHLHWFKWEAYTTWLSGFGLLVVLYYLDAPGRLVDPAVADLEAWQAIAVSVASLALGWLVYDALCRLVRDDRLLAAGVAALVVLAAWALGELLAARAVFLQTGAVLGTIMAGNVLFSIIPAHRELVRAKEAGREPDPAPALAAKRRSVHNNYLTLPVVFTMLVGHFPAAYAGDRAWLVLVAVIAVAAFFRHFFNLWHAGRRAWWIPAVSLAAAVAIAFWIAPEQPKPAAAVDTGAVGSVLAQRCLVCHSGVNARAGLRLDDPRALAASADKIGALVSARAMPPGNATGMTERERAIIAAWVAQAR